MGNRRSKNSKAKAKQPKALKSKHQAWDKKSDESASKSGSTFERFFFSLLCFQWFCNKHHSDATEPDEDDITLSRMAWHQSRSNQDMDAMMERVPGLRVGGDRIPTRRGGARPSFVLPYNQPASYEGAATAANASSSPASSLSIDASAVQSDLIQALEAMDHEGVRQSTRSPEEFGRVFSPLPGSVMEADNPVSYLLVTGARAAGFPVRAQSLAGRNGQLPPLRHTAGAPNPPSSSLTDVPLSITTLPGISSVSDAGEATEQEDDEFDFDEVISMPSDAISSSEPVNSDKMNEKEHGQSKKSLAAKKSGEKFEDLPGSDIPSLEEFVKQEEQKKKEEENKEKKERKKDRKQQKKDKKREKKLMKKITKMDRKKLMQKQKEEIKAEKAEKKAAKAEKANATEGESKKQSRLATRLHEMIKDSNKLAGDNMEMEQKKLEKKQRKQEAKARRKMREIARLELEVKILWQRLEHKDKKITQLCARRDRLEHRDFSVTEFKLDFRIGDYKRRFNNIKNTVDELKNIIHQKQMKVEKLAPHLLAEAAKKSQNLDCDDLSLESVSTINFDDNCSIASSSDGDVAEILDIIDLEDCSDSDSESDFDEEEHDDDDDDADYDFCDYDENEDEDEQIAKLFMNFCYCPTHDNEEEAEIEVSMAREEITKPAARKNDHSNVQEVLRKAQERLQKMDECRAAKKERHDGVAGPHSRKAKPSCNGKGKEPASSKPTVRKAFY